VFAKETCLFDATEALGADATAFFGLDCFELAAAALAVLLLTGPKEDGSIECEDLPRSRSARFVGAGGSGMV
jgi:hypothetical protein